MGTKTTKSSLYRVSGGTGKSHLWDEVKKASDDENVNGALYISLFGLSGIDQIKMKLIQSVIPSAEAHPKLWDGAKQAIKSSIKVLEGFHSGFGALNDFGLMFAPAMLSQKVIVIDDIERKHEKLSIDEVLGFIDEFIQQHGGRFVLILNSDKLNNREVWDTLREKVIDQEIRLDTSPSEAFGIAIGLIRSPYEERVRAAVEACGLTNIRIVRKVIKAVNLILGFRQDLTDAVLSRVIPSTALLAAIHYKGLEDGPDFEFVMAQGTSNDWSIVSDKDNPEDEDRKCKSKWKLLLNELGIHSCDEYEMLVVEYLQSGLFDVRALSTIIDRYVAEADEMNAREESRRFIEDMFWNHHLTEIDLLEKAIAIVPTAHLLDAYTVTSLHDSVSELVDGGSVADSIVKGWIDGFKAKNLVDIDCDDPFMRVVHPLIQAEFDAISAHAQVKTTVFDACSHIVKNGGWGNRQELAMKSATVAEIESVIRTVDVMELKLFMRRMLELTLQKSNYEQHFGSAMDHFVEACKNIVQDSQSERLGNIIKNLFAHSKLSSLIESPPTAVVIANS